jgi:hypothetical protein
MIFFTMQKYSIAIFFIVLLFACSSKQDNRSLIKTKDVLLHFETAISNVSNIAYFREGDAGYITYINSKAHSLNFRNIARDSIGLRIGLHSLDSIQDTEEGIACFVHTRDSIFILLNERNTIYLINSTGKITARWFVNSPLKNNNYEYILQDIPSMRLHYKDHRIYIQAIRDDIVVNTPENRKIYFNTPPEVILDISSPSFNPVNATGCWPAIYRNGEGYEDFWPARCINNRNELVYSFAINDSLFIYKDNKISMIADARSMFPKHVSPYPDDSSTHFAYLKKYNASESRYKLLLFNPYQDEYYRIFSRGVQDKDENGEQTASWSCIVLDPAFHRVCEMGFGTADYNYFSILPVPEGVLICRTRYPEDGRNVLRFGLFQLTKNEL